MISTITIHAHAHAHVNGYIKEDIEESSSERSLHAQAVNTMRVTSIVPVCGPLSGGSYVLITGVETGSETDTETVVETQIGTTTGTGGGFIDSPDLRCIFGDKRVRARWISPFEIECMSPKQWSVGTVAVAFAVGIKDDDIYPTHFQFEYYEDLVVLDFSPSIGPIAGGVNVTVTIHEEILSTDSLICKFGPASVPGYYVDSRSLNCLLLPGYAGNAVPISISKNGGNDFGPETGKLFQYAVGVHAAGVHAAEYTLWDRK